MTVGNLLALPQRNIKRMLAYSSISHAGFLLMGVAAYRGDFGAPGLLIYILAYTFTNLGAFFVAVAVGHRLESDEIPDYAGLAQRAPALAFLMALFMLSLTGIPPTAGFFGKFYIFGAAVDNGLLWLAIVGVVNSVVSLYYYVGVIRAMYLMPAPSPDPVPEPAALGVALGIAAFGTIVVGLFPQPFLTLVGAAALLLRP
jgi:NADH:ubiquinone oxidoreductase subunit 2 (subunit N)